MTSLIKQYVLGDMQALYYLDEKNGDIELLLLPEGISVKEKETDEAH
ncbi:MAG: hypothetical protein K5770_15375 [Lachnospiraceae bacterium]|nr:hypothetical protein [Lachnospiraceae bacterium]